MNKMNKKGFTLIEMLVVIAIIAALVSIIIPTVVSATDKAGAATNAANLRSTKAEIVTAMLTNDTTKYTFTKDSTTGKITGASLASGKTVPDAKKCKECEKTAEMYVSISDDEVYVYFGNGTNYWGIKEFADFAEGSATLAKATAVGSPATLG